MVKSFFYNKVAFDVMTHPEGGYLVKADTFFMHTDRSIYVTFISQNKEAFELCDRAQRSPISAFSLRQQARRAFFNEFLNYLQTSK